jgi:biopolymer transport protein ExbD
MKGEMCDINTTPLIDVMLVLLVTLIVSLPLMTHAVKLDIPQCNTTPPDNIRPGIIDLEIYFDGTVVWNGTTVPDFPTLENYFRAASNTITWPKCSWQRNVTVCSASASPTLQNSQTDEEPIMGGARRNPFYAVVAQVSESPSCSPSCRRTCCRRLTACASRSNNLTEVSQIKASVRTTLAVGQRLSRDDLGVLPPESFPPSLHGYDRHQLLVARRLSQRRLADSPTACYLYPWLTSITTRLGSPAAVTARYAASPWGRVVFRNLATGESFVAIRPNPDCLWSWLRHGLASSLQGNDEIALPPYNVNCDLIITSP